MFFFSKDIMIARQKKLGEAFSLMSCVFFSLFCLTTFIPPGK